MPLTALYLVAGRYLVYLFMENITGEAIDTGVIFLRIGAPFYFLISIKLVADGILRGAGLMGRFMIATFTDLVLRVALAFVLSASFGATGIWCAWPVGWALGTALSVVFYRRGPWKEDRQKEIRTQDKGCRI